jgi:hypothetical protein
MKNKIPHCTQIQAIVGHEMWVTSNSLLLNSMNNIKIH